jgi:hypothetical protein
MQDLKTLCFSGFAALNISWAELALVYLITQVVRMPPGFEQIAKDQISAISACNRRIQVLWSFA